MSPSFISAAGLSDTNDHRAFLPAGAAATSPTAPAGAGFTGQSTSVKPRFTVAGAAGYTPTLAVPTAPGTRGFPAPRFEGRHYWMVGGMKEAILHLDLPIAPLLV